MVNPADGTRYEIPLTYGSYWSDAVQRVYHAQGTDTPPVVGASRLEPISSRTAGATERNSCRYPGP
jgi:hypothetical protein